jgi:transposase
MALLTGINVRTAQHYLKMYNSDAERRLPGTYNKPRRRPPSKLNESHSEFLTKFIENNGSVDSR